jgi:hypothetical protein
VCQSGAVVRFDQAGGKFRASVVALLITGWMLAFAWPGLIVTFQGDDMMNMYRAWSEPAASLIAGNLTPFSHLYRPLGSAWYRMMYAAAGFHPLPFRIAVYGLLLVNLWVAFGVARALTGSREIGVLTALLISFHPGLRDLYQNGGTVYDILCFTFFWAAVWVYVHRGSKVVFLILSVLALNSKEMAVTLPAVLWIYEFLFRPPKNVAARLRWPVSGKLALWLLTAMVIASIPFKTGVSSVFANNPAYAPTTEIGPFLTTTRYWISELVYARPDSLRSGVAVAILYVPLAAGILLRRRDLMFCGAIIPILPLPVNFIPLRNFFVMYIPLLPWAMAAAIFIVAARDRLFAAQYHFKTELTFAALAIALLAAFGRDPHAIFRDIDPSQANIRTLQSGLMQYCPGLPRGGRILLRGDPFPVDVYDPIFVARLYYHDQDVQLSRTATESQVPVPTDVKWDCVLDFVGPAFQPAAGF